MWSFSVFMFLIFIVMGFSLGLTPFVSRKTLPFGVALPAVQLKSTHIQHMKNKFLIANVIVSGLLALPLFKFSWNAEQSIMDWQSSFYLVISIFVLLGFSFLLYLHYRNILLKEKTQLAKKHEKEGKKIVIDSSFHEKLSTKKPSALLIWQSTIILITVLLSLAFYERIPEQIPVHWNFAFEVDSYREKSLLQVLTLPIFQLLLIPIFQYSFYAFIASKQKLSPLKPVVSSKKSRLFRNAWSKYLFASAISTQLLLSALNLFSLFFNDQSFWPMLVIISLYLLVILGGTFYLMLKYGQAGERLKLDTETKLNEGDYYFDPEDEAKWIGGIFYYNQEDPSIFVEKRFGIGYTLNMARWQSWASIGGLVLFTLLILIYAFVTA